jgi:hypothetical protein
VQFGWKQVQNINKAPFDERYLGLLLVKSIRVDDGRINTPEI